VARVPLINFSFGEEESNMLFSIVAGVAIFGYAGWALVRYARKTRQGKCAACSLNKSCQSACSDVSALSGGGQSGRSV
jgi:hypothetical protein